jgi:hypothetical protein
MDMTNSFRALVYIVESPNPKDLFDGRTEGRILCEALRIAGIATEYRLVTSRAMFDYALTDEFVSLARVRSDQKLPILHISAHGNRDGIGLTDGTDLPWADLRHRFIPANEALKGLLIVGLSACDGASARQMAMWESGPPPFGLLFGHEGDGSWSDLAIGFAAFYHRFIHKNTGLAKSLEAMKMASGSDKFTVLCGPKIQADWTEYFEKRQAGLSHEDAMR